MPNHRSTPQGVNWRKPIDALNRHLLIAAVAVLAMVATLMSPASGEAATATPAPSADTLALSMVELLGVETAADPLTLAELVADVTGNKQRLYGSDGSGIDIALIDSGVAPVAGLDSGNVIHGPDLSGEGGHPEVAYLDTYGHGTHLAGIMVGQREGHEGIAPGARLVSLKVAGADGVTTVPQVVAAIDWVVEHRNTDGLNIRVLNLSLGLDNVSDHRGDLLSAAVERAWDAGIFVAVAAGNRGQSRGHLDSPAINPHVVAVGAVDSTDETRSKYQEPSSWTARGTGARHPDVAAPGVSVASYRVPGSTVDELAPNARYGDDLFLGSGTSQSAAVVSALAARLLADHPALTAEEAKATFIFSGRTRLFPAPVLEFGTGPVQGGVTRNRPQFGASIIDHPSAAGQGTGIVAPTGATWSGGSWSGATWSGATWSGATWSGATWSGATWSGATWSGATWSGNGWI